MLYFSDFCDIKDNKYRVQIITNNSSIETKELMMRDNPVNISQQSDGIFSPIKSRGCTISILAEHVFPEFYTFNSQAVSVGVYPVDRVTNMIDADHPLFYGYMTPGLYNQPFAQPFDFMELEAVDCIASLKTIKYSTSDAPNILSADIIIKKLLQRAGLSTTYTIPSTYKVGDSAGSGYIMNLMYLNESNFFDNDEEKTPWSCYEVLEEICRYLGWTLIQDGKSVKFVDYQEINHQTTKLEVTFGDYSSDDANVSYDDIYNKISISQNTYEYDDIVADITDDANLDSVTKESELGDDVYLNWYKLTYNNFLWWGWGEEEVKKCAEWLTWAHAKPKSGWEHYFYTPDKNQTELPNVFFDPDNEPLMPYSGGSTNMKLWKINKALNTKCALIQKYAATTNSSKNQSSLGWETYITFFNWNDRMDATGFSSGGFIRNYKQQPVLKFKGSENIDLTPSKAGEYTYITFKGDVWYQGDNVYNIFSTPIGSPGGVIRVSPIETVLNPEASHFTFGTDSSAEAAKWMDVIYALQRFSDWPDYGKGFPTMKYRLKIGNKYWNGTSWTITPSDFEINYNNSPKDDEKEMFFYTGWQSPVSNVTYDMKVGEDCYAIPISHTDYIRGKVELTIYSPNHLPGQEARPMGGSDVCPWYMSCPIVFMKNFEVGVKFTSSTPYYLDTDSETTEDIVFTNITENGDYVIENNEVELRINTFVSEEDCQSSLSKSHALLQNGYLQNLYNTITLTTQLPERHLVQRYFDHYHTKKMKYEASLMGQYDIDKPYIITAANTLTETKVFVIDSFSWDVANYTNNITFIEY